MYRTAVLFVCCAIGAHAHAQLVTDSFTYQGQLVEGGVPANGVYDMSFVVYDQESAGSIVFGGSASIQDVVVADGLFTVHIDFGVIGSVFDSDRARWLQVSVAPDGTSPLTALTPRQRITPAPSANYALRSGTTLNDAYQNGNIIDVGNNPIALVGDPVELVSLRFGQKNVNGGVSDLTMFNDEGVDVMKLNVNGAGSVGFRMLGDTRAFNFRTITANDDFAVQLPVGGVNSEEMHNEPGAAESINSSTVSLTNNVAAIDVIASVTINAPEDGYALVIGSAEVTVGHSNGTDSSVNVGVSSSSSGFDINTDLEVRVEGTNPSGILDHPATSHALYPVSEGLNTFYFLADKNWLGGFAEVGDTQLTAVYLPTNYGSISRETAGYNPMDAQTPRQNPWTQIEILNERNAALEADNRRQQREIDEMRAIVEQLKREAALED